MQWQGLQITLGFKMQVYNIQNVDDIMHDSEFTNAFFSEFDEHVGNRAQSFNSQDYLNVTILKRVGASGKRFLLRVPG